MFPFQSFQNLTLYKLSEKIYWKPKIPKTYTFITQELTTGKHILILTKKGFTFKNIGQKVLSKTENSEKKICYFLKYARKSRFFYIFSF
jgi:hypothetical protein